MAYENVTFNIVIQYKNNIVMRSNCNEQESILRLAKVFNSFFFRVFLPSSNKCAKN